MENVVPIELLAAFISDTIEQACLGIALKRDAGVFTAEYPENIDFDIVVISKWQALSIESISAGSDGGEDTSTSTGGSNGDTTTTQAATHTTHSSSGTTNGTSDTVATSTTY